MRKSETVVISVGGSLISPPSGIDTAFIKKLKLFIEKHVARGYRFVIITGGGATARNYQQAARAVGSVTSEDLDWLGIHSTRLNGHLVRTLLRKSAYPILITNQEKLRPTKKPVIVAAGARPGRSTDYAAVRIAQKLKIKKLVNLSNIDHVYTKDPKKHRDAKPIQAISWKEFRKLIPKKWDPGLSSPFDPVAAKHAESLGLEVAMLNGAKLGEFEKYLSGKKFVGTKIA